MIMTKMVSTFAAFPPLGLVLFVMLGMCLAEYTGMISVALRLVVSRVPRSLITFSIVIAGMISSVAADAGYVILIPLGGAIFLGLGRHPLVGIAAAFAGVSGGFGANLFPTGLDPMIAAFTELVAFIIVSSIVNLVMGSASAKWALLAPVFVPMIMLTGYSPETVQAAYRIGDSFTNVLAPLLPYFLLVIVFAQRYVKETGIGTLISLMLSFAVEFAVIRIPMLLLWIWLRWPLGVESPIFYHL